jgi:hypothetical protein
MPFTKRSRSLFAETNFALGSSQALRFPTQADIDQEAKHTPEPQNKEVGRVSASQAGNLRTPSKVQRLDAPIKETATQRIFREAREVLKNKYSPKLVALDWKPMASGPDDYEPYDASEPERADGTHAMGEDVQWLHPDSKFAERDTEGPETTIRVNPTYRASNKDHWDENKPLFSREELARHVKNARNISRQIKSESPRVISDYRRRVVEVLSDRTGTDGKNAQKALVKSVARSLRKPDKGGDMALDANPEGPSAGVSAAGGLSQS